MPRPPETTTDASDSCGREPFSSTTVSVILAALAASDSVTVDRDLLGRAGGRLGRERVRPHGDDRRALGDLGLTVIARTEDLLGGGAVGVEADRVVEQAGVELERQPGRDLLVLRGRGRAAPRPARPARRPRRAPRPSARPSSRRCRRSRRRRPSPRRTRRAGPSAAGGAGRADDDRARLAELAGGGEQFERGLLDGAVDRVDENQYLCHVVSPCLSPAQMSFLEAR